ncbi:hypothetical protein B0A55_05031 [Friedmanniomyces simplex]|uniref:Early meiotic induction protein 1 n=1 Tax=Friedmanniomyces simplex TaxID=329884 RepID=A0A4U0XDK4_9PEZI|nr:hypothetical protein B0A55_05031 [Friedmanniomyces simplex]
MGWLWSSSSTAAAPTDTFEETRSQQTDSVPSPTPPEREYSLSDGQRQRIFGRSPISQESHGANQDKADRDLEAFLNSFEPTTASSPTTTTTTTEPTSSETEPDQPHPPPTRLHPDGTLNIHPTALHPTTMSCRQAFDQAFYCQSLGGKFNDLYRFGHLRDCGEQWGAFWFCMRTRTLPARDKEGMLRGFYAERDRERRRRRGGDSEDVWELRTEAVERAFGRDPDEGEEDGRGGMKFEE